MMITLEQEKNLGIFWRKTLDEAMALGADSVQLKSEGDKVVVTVSSAGNELKSYPQASSWFHPLAQWLCDRASVFVQNLSPDNALPTLDGSLSEFRVSLKLSEAVVSFRVKVTMPSRGPRLCNVSSFEKVLPEQVVACLGMDDRHVAMFKQLLEQGRGVLIISSPDEINLKRSMSAVLSLGGAVLARDTETPEALVKIVELAAEALVCVGVPGDDAIDALFRLKERGLSALLSSTKGVLCQGFIRQVCPECAREAVADVSLVEQLPDELKFDAKQRYLVGRGCDECGHAGYSGLLGVQSVLWVDEELRRLFSSAREQLALVSYARQHGTVSLLEDGLTKVRQGRATLESLFQLRKVMPTWHAKHIQFESAKDKKGLEGFLGERSTPVVSKDKRERPLILILEDDDDQRAILEMVFKSEKYDIILAGDGKEGLELMDKVEPDLIITDLMMPRMDGREFVTRVKLDERHKHIPVLVLTVVSDTDKEYDLLSLGVDDYCEKTVQRKILLKRVANLIRRKG